MRDFLFSTALAATLLVAGCAPAPSQPSVGADSLLTYASYSPTSSDMAISRSDYAEHFQGFWLAECIANWTGLITEMDRIGGDGLDGIGAGFYTREDWGGPDQPNIWGGLAQGPLPDTIGFYFEDPDGVWGADDDTDIEYIYLNLMYGNQTTKLSGEQIRDGWLTHIYSDENTPFRGADDVPENFLWVSNQEAHDLMREGFIPPETSAPDRNPFAEMIDAQLTTEIFGLFAPGRPDIALDLAYLPIRTTARRDAAWIAEFYVVMHSLALVSDPGTPMAERLSWMADQARGRLPDSSYSAAMYDFVRTLHESGSPWEATRDSLHERFQVRQENGYRWSTEDTICNGCFAAGINFGASLVSLFYGEGDLLETIKIGSLAGWDSDNPTATWGGLIGFMLGKSGVEEAFGRTFSDRFNIHRTRGGFGDGLDTFDNMARMGVFVTDRIVQESMQGGIDLHRDVWYVPPTDAEVGPPESEL